MKLVFRLSILLLLILAGYWLSQKLLTHSALEKVGIEIPSQIELDISRGYVIPEQKRLSYTLSQSPEKLWISSSAILSTSDSKTVSYPYGLIVSVFDKNDNVLYRNEFHHQSVASKQVELKINGQTVPDNFLADQEQKLSAPQSVHFQLPPGATRLEISQQVKSAQIDAVVIRAYQFVQRSSRVAAIDLWQRLSQKQRRNLTENFPFEEPFLSNEEKSHLAEFRWQPLVPQGDENEDYDSILLYRVNKQYIANKKHLLSQYEHHADAYKRVSFPIEVAGRYRLEGQHEFTQRDLRLQMQWFNKNDSWMKTEAFTFDTANFSQELELKPGLVTFTTSIPASLNLFAISGFVEEHDHFSSAILLLPGQELKYRVEHPTPLEDEKASLVTPMLIQVRAFAEQEISTGAEAKVTITGEFEGQRVNEEYLEVEYTPDENSQLVNEEFFNWLGIAKKLYLQVSKATDNLRITSNQPVLVTVYTRLADMPAIRVLPEEKRDWFDYPSGVPDWFSVRPENWEERVNLGSIRLLKHYHRSLLQEQEPPDPDETYQSLLTDFERLDLLDIMVENPFYGQVSKMTENTALNFAPVADFQATEFSHTALSTSAKPVPRRWLFLKNIDEPLEIQWSKNGVLQDSFWVAGKWGIVDAVDLFVYSNDQISFITPDIQWWQNDVPREQARWQQRRGALLRNADVIQIGNSKTQLEEMLSLVVYSTSTAPVILKVTLSDYQRNPGIKDNFTITQRQYQIHSQQAYSGFQLAGNRRIVSRQAFSILSGTDILPGDQQIKIEHLQGDDVFVSLVKRVILPKPIIERYRTVSEH